MASKILSRLKALETDANLVAWWKFNDGSGSSVTDTQGGSAGTASNMTWGKGRIGAYSGTFNGSTSYVAMTKPTFWDSNVPNMTVSMWVKPDVVQGSFTQVFAAYDSAGGNNNGGLKIEVAPSGNQTFFFQIYDAAAATNHALNSGTYEPGRWYHLSVAIDGTSFKAYVDGILVDSTTMANNLDMDITNAFEIGRSSQNPELPALYFDGDIDDVKIFDRTLTDLEVEALGNQQRYANALYPRSEITNGLIGRWTNSRETTDTTLKDISGKGNNGTLIGGVGRGVVGKDQRFGLEFDGVDDKISVGDISTFAFMHKANAKYTIATYVKFNEVGNSVRYMILGGDGDTRDNVGISFAYDEISSDEIRFRISNGNGVVETSKIIETTWAWTPLVDTWYHLAVTWDHSLPTANAELFINGVSQGTKNKTSNTPAIGNPTNIMTIGSRTYNNDMFMNGLMDDIRIYNRALTPTEIQTLYDLYK